MDLKVCKFGGSSVSCAEQFKKVKNIIRSDESRKVIVISAVGQRSKEDNKITDLLYLCHAHLTYGVRADDIFDMICSRFVQIKKDLGLNYDIESELEQIKKRLNKDINLDYLVSRGEYLTSKLMSSFLGYTFVDAESCIFMNYDGSIDYDKTVNSLKKNYSQYGKIVIPGFYGVLPSGRLKLMSRGGSDITGSIVSSCLDADTYENWTDVSGILMADPGIVDNPGAIEKLTYAELRELSYMGAKVLHEDAVQPVRDKGIPLNIRNTNEPDQPGTVVVDDNNPSEETDRFITGIAGRKNYFILKVRKPCINVNKDLSDALAVMQNFNVGAEHITLGPDSFGMVISDFSLGDNKDDFIAVMGKKFGADNIIVQDNIALVASVGRNMKFRPGVSGKLFKDLGDSGINIRIIAQQADELSITVGVDDSMFEKTVRVLYEGFTC